MMANGFNRHLSGGHQPLRHHHLAGMAAFRPAAQPGAGHRRLAGYHPPASLLAQELEIGAQSIDAFILGEHGDTQFPVWSHSSVYGTPIADLYQQRTGLPLDREAMADKVRKLGFEIYAGKGCTEYGVAGTIARSAAISSPAATARWRSPAFLTASTGSAARRLGCRRCWPRVA